MCSEVCFFNIEFETLQNKNFRNVVCTLEDLQIVLMSLKPHQKIDFEKHTTADQFFRIEEGCGEFIYIDKNDKVIIGEFQQGDGFVIPKGTYHQIKNSSPLLDLKIYTVYSTPLHHPHLIQKFKPIE